MHILIVTKDRSRAVSLSLGSRMYVLLFCLFALSIASLYYNTIPQHIAQFKFASSDPYKDELAISTKELVNAEIVRLDAMQDNLENSLSALAIRISKLQAHITRLDALGSRLVNMANVEGVDFELHDLGLGGPIPNTEQKLIGITELVGNLQKLESSVKDRREKLYAIESILIDLSLHDQAQPTNKPIEKGWISSPFGWRSDPFTGKKEFHQGIDYVGKAGSYVISVASGIVIWSGKRSGYGNVVDINHGNGLISRYAHNKKNLVNIGDKVEKGDKIAIMGSTGRSTGHHVHLEVIKGSQQINPTEILSSESES